MNRRDAFKAVAVTASGGLLMSQQAFAQETGASASQTAALLQGADVCAIIPEVTEGPYYFDPAMERVDITEGRPGIGGPDPMLFEAGTRERMVAPEKAHLIAADEGCAVERS